MSPVTNEPPRILGVVAVGSKTLLHHPSGHTMQYYDVGEDCLEKHTAVSLFNLLLLLVLAAMASANCTPCPASERSKAPKGQ